MGLKPQRQLFDPYDLPSMRRKVHRTKSGRLRINRAQQRFEAKMETEKSRKNKS